MSSGYAAGRSCNNSQRWIPGGTEFCSFCGQQKIASPVAEAVAPSDATRCARCNSPLDVSQEFCANCGLATGHAAPPTPGGRASSETEAFNAWAIASFVVALSLAVSALPDYEYGRATHARADISFVPTMAIAFVAAILGLVALRKFRSSPIPLRGRLLAKVGFRLGLIGLILGILATITPRISSTASRSAAVRTRHRGHAHRSSCRLAVQSTSRPATLGCQP